jgi:hypothetical protein
MGTAVGETTFSVSLVSIGAFGQAKNVVWSHFSAIAACQ